MAQKTRAPLEDACHLTLRYDKLCQEDEAQAAEVLRRQSKSSESFVSVKASMRVQKCRSKTDRAKIYNDSTWERRNSCHAVSLGSIATDDFSEASYRGGC